ncbi:MAG: hypothetical protein BWY63_02300 [Chloroflexi bacterium ADurb.Bin360]|nr:MAG: hypothetical protein BWY63_02300 [Chloroflexi bacterium ADurb.Bin360]
MSHFRQSRAYRVLLWLILSLGLLLVLRQSLVVFVSPKFLANDDFVQYWAAGRLNFQGNNPYDPELLRPLQHEAGRTEYIPGVATIVWNPPWTMPLLMFFGALPYPVARALWFMGSFALLAGCGMWIWSWYAGAPRLRWVPLVLSFTFMPALLMLRVGQIGAFMFAGVLGFLSSVTKRQWLQLGAWVILLSVKPQLVFLLPVVLLLWLVERRQLKPILGGALILLGALGVASIFNPQVTQQYLHAFSTQPPVAWATPTLGSVLRWFLGHEKFWLSLIPALAGLAWVSLYWWRRRNTWDWITETPLLIFVSLLTTPYVWTYDLLLLLLPISVVVVHHLRSALTRESKWLFIALGVLNALMLIVQLQGLEDFWFVWVAPVLFVWYLWGRSQATIT